MSDIPRELFLSAKFGTNYRATLPRSPRTCLVLSRETRVSVGKWEGESWPLVAKHSKVLSIHRKMPPSFPVDGVSAAPLFLAIPLDLHVLLIRLKFYIMS